MNLKDIAVQANVSSATVSMVLHGKEGVSDETRAKVEKLLTENGYSIAAEKIGPVKNIRFLKYSNHSYLVDDNPGFVSAVIDAVERECRRVGYNLMMTVLRPKNLEEGIKNLEKESPDGVLLLGTEWTPENYRYLENLKSPLVVIDNSMAGLPCHCVTGNQSDSMFTIVSYLKGLGHEKVGYLMNTSPSCNCQESLSGFKAALAHFGLAEDPSHVYLVRPTFTGAYESMKEYLKKGVRFPSALVTNNDNLALGAMKALKEGGYRIPEDISIVGTDNISAAAMADPPLTSMDPGCKQLGIWAVRLLKDIMQYPDSPVTKIRLTSRLIERNSVGPCEKPR